MHAVTDQLDDASDAGSKITCNCIYYGQLELKSPVDQDIFRAGSAAARLWCRRVDWTWICGENSTLQELNLIIRKRHCLLSNQFCLILLSVGFPSKKVTRLSSTVSVKWLLQEGLTLVRPILEYCCRAWDPFLSKDIKLLEPVQKFVIKVWQSDGMGRTAQWNSLLLKERRAAIKACHGLKVPEWSNGHASKYFCSPCPLKLGPAVTQQLH